MKEKPILFNTEMVKAILQGRKIQTRRIIKPQLDDRGVRTTNVLFEDWHGNKLKPPCQVGNILWVRETWLYNGVCYIYKTDNEDIPFFRWKPSIHMPKSACRLKLEVINIRAERLQEIGRLDAIAEGIKACTDFEDTNYKENYYQIKFGGKRFNSAVEAYQNLWESIYGNGSWEANPFVWVIEFKKI